MVKKLATAAENVQIAAELIRGTAQRPSAAISMRHDHFSEDWMEVLNEKSDEMFPAFCPPRLREFVGGIRKRGAHILAKNLREPTGDDAIEKSFRPWRNDLGEQAQKYTLHGLRKLAVIELAESGASDAEIRAVTGQSAQMIASYRARVNRKMRSRNAQGRRERCGTEQNELRMC